MSPALETGRETSPWPDPTRRVIGTLPARRSTMTEANRSLSKRGESYAPHEHVPLTGYATMMVTFAIAVGVATRLTRRRPNKLHLLDLALVGVATHKLSRILAKDFVTAPLRAPFTSREGLEGAGEVHDEPRKGPWRGTIGNLVSCPYCLGPWLAVGFGTFTVLRPAEARFVAFTLSAVTVADFLHQRYARLNESRKLVQAERRQAQSLVERG